MVFEQLELFVWLVTKLPGSKRSVLDLIKFRSVKLRCLFRSVNISDHQTVFYIKLCQTKTKWSNSQSKAVYPNMSKLSLVLNVSKKRTIKLSNKICLSNCVFSDEKKTIGLNIFNIVHQTNGVWLNKQTVSSQSI